MYIKSATVQKRAENIPSLHTPSNITLFLFVLIVLYFSVPFFKKYFQQKRKVSKNNYAHQKTKKLISPIRSEQYPL